MSNYKNCKNVQWRNVTNGDKNGIVSHLMIDEKRKMIDRNKIGILLVLTGRCMIQ